MDTPVCRAPRANAIEPIQSVVNSPARASSATRRAAQQVGSLWNAGPPAPRGRGSIDSALWPVSGARELHTKIGFSGYNIWQNSIGMTYTAPVLIQNDNFTTCLAFF
jgi:hypothetical protein